MKQRLVPRIQGSYQPAEYAGKNVSGIDPIGKRVLVLMDDFEATFAGGKLEFLPELVERMNLASESGVVIAAGDEAFSRHTDGSLWHGRRPQPGDHIYADKYAGLLVMGNDGKKYRLMEDSCIGAIYLVDGPGE